MLPNETSKRRDKLYIIAEILEIAKCGTLKTQVMYRANLSFSQLNTYLKFVLKTGLLDKILEGGKNIYLTTEKGLDFLQRYREIAALLNCKKENWKNGVKIPPPHLIKNNRI